MAEGRRYEGQSKLNMKKVISLIISILVIIMVIISIQKIISAEPQTETKISNIEYYPVYTNEWGVIDTNGDIVIEPTYEEMIIVPDSQKPVFICSYDVKEDGTYKTKIINDKNEELFTEYSLVTPIDNHDKNNNLWYEKNILKVMKDGKYGVVNFEGKEIIKCEYDEITALPEVTNELLVKKDGKYGIINEMGTTVLYTEYVSISALGTKAEDGYIIRNEDGYGIATSSKKIIITPQYDEIKKFTSNDMYAVRDEGWKVVNKNNEVVVSSGFDDIAEINSDSITIVKDGKYGVISTSGTELIPAEYEYLKYAFDTYYIVKKDGKYGLVDQSNYTQLKITYENITYRNDAGFIEADTEDFTTEVYDKNLELRLTGIINEVNVEDGYIRVWENDNYKYYNFKFEEKTNIEVLKGKTLYLTKKNGKYGYVDKNNNVIVDCIYEDAQEQNIYGYCAVKKDGKWQALDKQGKLIENSAYEMANNTKFDFIGKWHIGRDLNMNYYTDIN